LPTSARGQRRKKPETGDNWIIANNFGARDNAKRGNRHMHSQHELLLARLKKHQRPSRAHTQANDSYLSSGHHYYDVSIPDLRALAKAWLKDNRSIAGGEFVAVLDGLYRGKSYEERVLASILLSYHRAGRATIATQKLDGWLDGLVGWAEVDALCAWWPPDELLAAWPAWRRLIRALARDRNINKRRAALVLLTAPIRNSNDARLAALAFETIERLQPERDKMITKAVSWLLRSMTRHHKRAVAAYLKEERATLPAIAVREASRKIATGRK
jgi:3-methyladenine DNA glycosylase AlkD